MTMSNTMFRAVVKNSECPQGYRFNVFADTRVQAFDQLRLILQRSAGINITDECCIVELEKVDDCFQYDLLQYDQANQLINQVDVTNAAEQIYKIVSQTQLEKLDDQQIIEVSRQVGALLVGADLSNYSDQVKTYIEKTIK
jgi:chaperonin cofactor prefoldin